MNSPTFIVVDLFCGAGGTTTGFAMTDGIAKVIACVNHDAKAIESHWKNHPEVEHFEEDIRKLKMSKLVKVVKEWKKKYPKAYLILWASLECTNFSKAKGGQPREADSRTLADELDRYVLALNPDFIQIENVVEFMSWGPLDENGKPISKKNGSDWMRWRKLICSHGYHDKWTEMNSADYGAYTSRNRLFGCFAKGSLPIIFPEPTHSKKPSFNGLHGDLQKWKAVKDVLDFSDEGESIFNRKKPLADNTLERIFAGLVKFVANGDDTAFISKYYSGRPKGKVIPDLDEPCPVVATQNRLGLIQGEFLDIIYGNGYPSSINSPAPTIRTKDGIALVKINGAGQNQSIDQPAGTIMTSDKHTLVETVPFIMPTNFNNKPVSIDEPCQTITANRKHHYIVNPSHGGNLASTDKPCPVIVARQDKAPLYLIQAESGECAIPVYDNDSEVMIRIKQFMLEYGLVDITMRMLKVLELLQIQGFPADYVLCGNQSDQKKFIGNSVVPHVVKEWAIAMHKAVSPCLTI